MCSLFLTCHPPDGVYNMLSTGQDNYNLFYQRKGLPTRVGLFTM